MKLFRLMGMSFLRLIKKYPLLLVTLVALCMVGLSLTRDWFDVRNYGRLSTLLWALVTSLVAGTALYGRTNKRNPLVYLVTLGLCLSMVWIMPEKILTSHAIVLTTVTMIGFVELVRYPLTQGHRGTVDIHHRIGHILQHIAWGIVATAIFAIGLSVSLEAISVLFNVSIDWNWHGTVWVVIGTLLGGTLTIDGVLSDVTYTTPSKRKTTLARIITILIGVFTAIIYVYLGKILITRQRPSNQIGFWGFLTIGLLFAGSLLVLPLLDYDAKKKQTLDRVLHLVMVPIVVVVAIALYQRIGQHGITETRWVSVILLGVVAGIALRHIVRRQETSYGLLLSLSAAGILAVGTMRPVSYYSQHNRLVDYLKNENITLSTSMNLTEKQESTLWGMVTYFSRYHGADLSDLHPDLTLGADYADVLYVAPSSFYRNNSKRYSYNHKKVDITGYTTLYADTFKENDITKKIDKTTISIQTPDKVLATFDASDLVNSLPKNNGHDKTPLILKTDNALFLIDSMSIQQTDSEWHIKEVDGMLLIK